MIRVCAAADYLTEKNKRQIREASEKLGFEADVFDSEAAADGKVAGYDIIYCDTPVLLPQMEKLKWAHTSFAGVGPFVETGIFDDGSVILTNSSGAYGLPISEYTIMMTLMLFRRMPEYRRIIDERRWDRDLPVRSIAGSRIAIIGMGDIGRNAAARYRALGAESVTGFSRSGRPAEGFDRVFRIDELDEVLTAERSAAQAGERGGFDALLLCVPGTPETAGLLSRKRIDMLGSGTCVINVGRGTVIDHDALADALSSGRIAGAALDVTDPEPLPLDHPLWTEPGCILTPHMSGDTGMESTIDKTVDFFCENLERYARGEKLINVVDISAGY